MEAYEDLRTKPKVLNGRQTAVYQFRAAAPEPLTLSEIFRGLGWKINCLTGRMKELRDAKLIFERGHRFCQVTDRYVHGWDPPGPIADAPRPGRTKRANAKGPRQPAPTPEAAPVPTERPRPVQQELFTPRAA